MKYMNDLIPKYTTEITTSSTELFNKMIERFTEFVDVSEISMKSYRTGIKKFIMFLNEQGITNPTRETIVEYKKSLCQKYSSNTIGLYLSSIRKFFTWLESEGLYQNITSGVKSPKISHEHKRDAFSASELKTIVANMKHDTVQELRDYAIFTLIASCGLRTIEVTRANVGDIHSVMGVTVLDIQGKGHSAKDSFVKLSDPVLKAITEYLSARGAVADDEPLFASCSRRNKGGRLTTRTISAVCKKAMKTAGFDSKRLTAHSLRHSAVTLALLAGMSLDDVSQFARHSSVNITMVYNHSINRMKSACEATVSNAIFGR